MSQVPRLARQRLWLARTMAWALLLSGWLVLGSLGRQHLPLLAGGQMPVALWLVVIGSLLTWAAPWRVSAGPLRGVTLCAGGLGVAALMQTASSGEGRWLLTATVCWAALLVAASFTVRRLRQVQPHQPPSPIGAASVGALLAWCAAGDLEAVRHGAAQVGMALGMAAALLAALVPGGVAPSGGCRAGLFDCSLPLLSPGRWDRVADWPQSAASLAMLPMMAALPVMADWCGALNAPAAAGTALHLGAMLLPALLQPALAVPVRHLAWVTGGLLVLGGLALLLPGLPGLMAASLLHGLAWGCVWAGRLQSSQAPSTAAIRRPAAGLRSAAWTASAVLLLGLMIDQAGPVALVGVHAWLAALGLFGLLALGARGRHGACRLSP